MGLLSMSCFNRQGEVKADDAKYTGTEPTWDDADKLTEYQLTERMAKGLAFYSYYCTKKDLFGIKKKKKVKFQKFHRFLQYKDYMISVITKLLFIVK